MDQSSTDQGVRSDEVGQDRRSEACGLDARDKALLEIYMKIRLLIGHMGMQSWMDVSKVAFDIQSIAEKAVVKPQGSVAPGASDRRS